MHEKNAVPMVFVIGRVKQWLLAGYTNLFPYNTFFSMIICCRCDLTLFYLVLVEFCGIHEEIAVCAMG